MDKQNGLLIQEPCNATARCYPQERQAAGGVKVSERSEKPKRQDQPANRMTPEEAERLRALLRGTGPADYQDPSALQRIGREIARAISRGPPKPIDTKKD